jgi:hypothetical protein
MTKKVALALGCLALVTSFASTAMADAITFSFLGVRATPLIAINNTGVNLGPAALLALSDTDTNNVFVFAGSVFIKTGAASSYSAAGGVLVANFNPGPGIEVEVDSANCVGGAHPGICLQGTQNSNGAYVAFQRSTGSFQALFNVNYVSPYVTSLFGDPNLWLPSGSDSFTTGHNNFTNGHLTDLATLGQGGITFQTVPEPGTLALLGSGLVGLAGVIRRKLR